MSDQVKWMSEALKEGEAALQRREVPVGCVFVLDSSEIVGSGGNEVNATGNATRHAEIVALDKMQAAIASGQLEGFRSVEELAKRCVLYVTCEPCIMCAAALSQVNVGKIVFGCANDKFGGCGSVVNAVAEGIVVESGLMEEEAVALFRLFYNRENPLSKTNLQNQIENSGHSST